MRILVVEDEKHLNRIISEAVEDEGYSVDSCFNGQEALEFMECAKYDVMILDIMMPKLNGLDLVRRLRRDGDTTPVLFLTARDSVADRVEMIENNLWNYDYEGGTNVVDVYVGYLRKKMDTGFDKKLIQTVWGTGWVLKED